MRKIQEHRYLALLAVLALGACDAVGVGPGADDLAITEAAELIVLQDDPALASPVEFSDVSSELAASLAHPGVPQGRALNAQALVRFHAAREALRDGDRRRALEEAREARRLVARALVAMGGEEAVLALIERIEELALSIDPADTDVFDDPESLKRKLEALVAEARRLLSQGNLVAAAERALLGEQIARYHRGRVGHRGEVSPDRARLAVALATTAVALAERIVADEEIPVRPLGASDVGSRQNHWLAHARRMLAKAEESFEAGRYARAVHFAEHAHGSALKAAILPGGVTDEELEAMVDLAHTLLARAEAAVAGAPTELRTRLLGLARRLVARGEELIADGKKRGVGPVWRGAVIARWLIG
jgi:HEPN domain-containing protein